MYHSDELLDWLNRLTEWIPGWTLWVWLAIGIVLILIIGAFYVTACMEAYLEVKNKPREAMGWCNKHGLIRKKHMLPLGFTDVCPMCYKQSLDQAGEIR